MGWLRGFFIAGFALLLASPAPASDEEAVREAADAFYVALNAMFTGDLGPMDAIWSHADDVTYLGPADDFVVGWKGVRASWAEQAERKLGGKVTAGPLAITVGPELAVVRNREQGENVDADGEPQSVSIRATSVFRKEDGRWKMISHHTDLLPFLAD